MAGAAITTTCLLSKVSTVREALALRVQHSRRAPLVARFVFEQVLERCVRGGLVGGEGFAVDASLVAADASRQRGVPSGDAD